MTPGRELDALIAERVMGRVLPESGEDRAWMIAFLPHYSTNIADAWDVVEKFKHLEPEIRWDDENRGWYLNFTKKELGILPYGSTAPHAICLAALRAWGVKYEE